LATDIAIESVITNMFLIIELERYNSDDQLSAETYSSSQKVLARLMACFERIQTKHKAEERFEAAIRVIDTTADGVFETDANSLTNSLTRRAKS